MYSLIQFTEPLDMVFRCRVSKGIARLTTSCPDCNDDLCVLHHCDEFWTLCTNLSHLSTTAIQFQCNGRECLVSYRYVILSWIGYKYLFNNHTVIRLSSWYFSFMYRKYIVAFIVCPIVFYIPRFFEIRSFVKVYAYNETIDCSALFLNEPSHQLMFLKDNQSQSFLKVLNRGTLQYENQWMNLTLAASQWN